MVGHSVQGLWAPFLKRAPKIQNRRNVKYSRKELQKKKKITKRLYTHSPHINKSVTAEEWTPI